MTDRDALVSEIFTVKARRCKRCGGLLTSSQAIADGYGHTCLMKERGESQRRRPVPGQMDLFADSDENDET